MESITAAERIVSQACTSDDSVSLVRLGATKWVFCSCENVRDEKPECVSDVESFLIGHTPQYNKTLDWINTFSHWLTLCVNNAVLPHRNAYRQLLLRPPTSVECFCSPWVWSPFSGGSLGSPTNQAPYTPYTLDSDVTVVYLCLLMFTSLLPVM